LSRRHDERFVDGGERHRDVDVERAVAATVIGFAGAFKPVADTSTS
jgi:hypothetical protein